MSPVKLHISPDNLTHHDAVRIQQGEISAGPEPQGTILKSCICVGFHHSGKKIGAISHITGFNTQGGHSAAGALSAMRKAMGRHGLELEDCECFLLGGVDRARQVYEEVVRELRNQGLRFRELDVLGAFHRKLLFNRATGVVDLFKKADREPAAEAGKALASDPSYSCFHDPRRRLITGASLFFRNAPLLRLITQGVTPAFCRNGGRFHVWCAGCSLGMEAYSVAMVVLDYLAAHSITRCDFRILGTDISEEALEVARAGVYSLSPQSAKDHERLFNRYVERLDAKSIRVTPELRSVVAFKQHDIRAGSRRHLFEMVLCDHVFQYFSPDVQTEFLKGLVSGVRDSGYLFVSTPSPGIGEILSRCGSFETLERHFYRRTRPDFQIPATLRTG